MDLFEGDLAVSFFGEFALGEVVGGGLFFPGTVGSGDKEPSLLASFFTVDSFFAVSSFLTFALSAGLSGDFFLSS